ncbi:hypothetical protein [Gracilibacillus dipsosauri]|uniref:Lipoprotein n=1 Tax=Gracilibacillus dipsosauri TaxID=178340 RepID=A0A317L388_9BACI|nr:hypothetical protein [Gracilibacillus dipsosauri]PWU70287.1 hypothetical protein DLJ74_00130 [Gracilibacillus dipsosauri]
MKKFLFPVLCISTITAFLIGCSDKNDTNLGSSFDQAQQIEVLSSTNGELQTTIADNQKIADFVSSLKLDKWELAQVPSEAIAGSTFLMNKQQTIRLGESTNEEKRLQEVAKIITYENVPFVDLVMKDNKLSFSIPENVASYLQDFK